MANATRAARAPRALDPVPTCAQTSGVDDGAPDLDVDALLAACSRGDGAAQEQLLAVLYRHLRDLAQGYLRRERPGHTLQPTALVHEAWMKLIRERNNSWESRGHFLAAAARAMRRVLVHHAEKRHAERRGGGKRPVTLFEEASVFEERAEDLMALDAALERLALRDREKAQIVELRFFGGLSVEETATVTALSTRSVERGWQLARAWLRREVEVQLSGGSNDGE